MANKVVEWIIRANYKQPKRESDSLGDSLKRLARRREELNKSQIAGDRQADESMRKRHKAEREGIKLHQAMQQATSKTTSATDLSTKATGRHAKASRDDASALSMLTGALKSHTVARRAAAAATAQHNREMEANRRYGAEIQRNELSAAAATQSLAAAKQRLAKAEADHGKASNQYAQALTSVRRREIEVEQASGRLASSHAKLSGMTRQVDRDHNTWGRTLGRLDGWLFRSDRTTGQWLKTMAKGTFT